METAFNLDLDVVVIGGGCAGLWLLDDLRRRGLRVLLLEARDLGSGQTASAQGILHGGLKYSLAGILSPSARAAREMPAVWEACLQGRAEPDLSNVRLRSEACYLWRGPSLFSWASMLGAVAALAVRPEPVPEEDLPAALGACPRPVYRVDERVIDPLSFLEVLLRRNRGCVWKVDGLSGMRFECQAKAPRSIAVRQAGSAVAARLQPRWIVLAAGEGNAMLREQLGLPADVMQRRPLRIALVRGQLPPLHGHCVEGAKTRLTVTSDVDRAGRTVWQLGGQVTEDGARMEPAAFLQHARDELQATLPGVRFDNLEWATFTVDRAERSTADGAMPGDVQWIQDGNVLSVWPTKLVLAPRLGQLVGDAVDRPTSGDAAPWRAELERYQWPAPAVARPPWEEDQVWTTGI